MTPCFFLGSINSRRKGVRLDFINDGKSSLFSASSSNCSLLHGQGGAGGALASPPVESRLALSGTIKAPAGGEAWSERDTARGKGPGGIRPGIAFLAEKTCIKKHPCGK